MCISYNYDYPVVIYVSLAGFELQRHKLVNFGEKNIYTCHLGVFKQQSRLLGSCKSYFADAYEACQCYFELRVDVKFVAVGRLKPGNLKENFSRNRQEDGFCVEKKPFATLNKKAEPRRFKLLY